jgi:hypothetical protein
LGVRLRLVPIIVDKRQDDDPQDHQRKPRYADGDGEVEVGIVRVGCSRGPGRAQPVDDLLGARQCRKAVSGDGALRHMLQRELPDVGSTREGRVRHDQIQQVVHRLEIDGTDRKQVEDDQDADRDRDPQGRPAEVGQNGGNDQDERQRRLGIQMRGQIECEATQRRGVAGRARP